MIIHQLSVFLENKSGRLIEVLEVLGEENIRITERARELLKKQNFTVNLTEVISVMAPNEAKHYAKILRILSDLDISVEYTYAFSVGAKSIIILRCSDTENAIKALKSHEMELLKASDLYKI